MNNPHLSLLPALAIQWLVAHSPLAITICHINHEYKTDTESITNVSHALVIVSDDMASSSAKKPAARCDAKRHGECINHPICFETQAMT